MCSTLSFLLQLGDTVDMVLSMTLVFVVPFFVLRSWTGSELLVLPLVRTLDFLVLFVEH